MNRNPLDHERRVNVGGEDFEVTADRESGEFSIARVRDEREVAHLKRDSSDGHCVAHCLDDSVPEETMAKVVASARGRGLVPETTSDAILHHH